MKRSKEIAVMCIVILLGTYMAWAVVSGQTTKVSFTCNGSTTEFACTGGNKIPCFANTDMKVYVRNDTTGVETLQVLTTNYTVAAFNNDYTNGFTVTMNSAPASGQTLVVKRSIALTQEVNLIRGRAIPQEGLERTLDRQMLALQDYKEELSRTIRARVTDPAVDFNLPSTKDTAGKYLAVASDGLSIVPTEGTTSDIVVSSWAKTFNDDATPAEARGTLELDTDDNVEFAAITGTTGTLTDIITKSPLVDIRAFLPDGYVTDGSVDYTAQIQAAFDTAPYKTVFIPDGTWKITSTINVGVSTSVRGVGFNSRIIATGCNGFSIPISGSLGGTEWSQLQISGDSGSAAYYAIGALGTAVQGSTSAGITFRKLYINKIGTAFKLRSFSQGLIFDCAINDVWYGIHIEGKVIRSQIQGCEITRDYLGTGVVTGGAGNSTGILIDDADDYDPGGATSVGPESMMITNNGIAGFEYAVHAITGLYYVINENDLDRATVSAVKIDIKNGGVSIRDNWINIIGANALYGVHFPAVGASHDRIVTIEHNEFTATTPHANSQGVRIATKQDSVYTLNNHFGGFKLYDIYYLECKGGIVRDNVCASTDPATYSIVMDSMSGGSKVSGNICAKAVSGAIPTLADDATPSIKYSNVWLTGGTTTLTDLDDGQEGDVITLIGQNTLTITDGTNFILDGGANMSMTSGDTLMLIQLADTKWYQLSESDNN